MMYVYSYNRYSKSARALARELRASIIHKDSNNSPIENDKVINWGATSFTLDRELMGNIYVYNEPNAVKVVSNKLSFFGMMEGTGLTPQFWTDPEELDDNTLIVARTVLNGHSGRGIIIKDSNKLEELDEDKLNEFLAAPLYVEYKKKKYEFRVHIFRGEVFDIQQKARRRSIPDDQVNWQVRNHKNGFIYKRELDAPLLIRTECAQAAWLCMDRVAIDFGAVDVIWNEQEQRPYVLEINTAPGLSGTTLTNYVNVFRGLENG